MACITTKLVSDKTIKDYPKWLPANIHYETIMGSQAYGVSRDSSDCDVYGWCLPPLDLIFPHRSGHIEGFGPSAPRFDQFIAHHIKDAAGNEYDITIYNVVKYLQLVMENNPNMIDSIFTPYNCVTHCTTVGSMLRDERKHFLHKGAYHKFKGYAYAQMHKIRTADVNAKPRLIAIQEFEHRHEVGNVVLAPALQSEYDALYEGLNKRELDILKFGVDVKFAYHTVRLLNECEQILVHGDLDLQHNNEHLKAIRRGEVSLEDIKLWFAQKERQLDDLYHKSTLPHGPDWQFGRTLLFNVFEHHYGSFSEVVRHDDAHALLRELTTLVEKYS